MPGFWTRQPGIALYTAFAIFKALVTLPFIAAYYLPSSTRPYQRWTWHQAMVRTLVRIWFEYTAKVEFRVPFNLEAGQEKERFVILAPHEHHHQLQRGELQSVYQAIPFTDPNIRPCKIGAIWHSRRISRPSEYQPGSRIFLHFHGGAYVLFGCRDKDVGSSPRLLLDAAASGSAVLFPQYRLASYPNGRFPAALQDAVTAYCHLVYDLQVPPESIVLSGDSAGGNLALALLRHICQGSAGVLPEPGGLLLWSPWVDLTVSPESFIQRPSERVDMLPVSLFRWADRAFMPSPSCRGQEDPRENPYLSPVKQAIATRVPIWVNWGQQEVLKEDIVAYVEKQKLQSEKSGGRLGTWEVPHVPHDIFLGGEGMGFPEEAVLAADNAIRFLDA